MTSALALPLAVEASQFTLETLDRRLDRVKQALVLIVKLSGADFAEGRYGLCAEGDALKLVLAEMRALTEARATVRATLLCPAPSPP